VSLSDQGFIKYLKFLIMKNLLNLKNAKILSKKEQKNVFGGQLYLDGGTVNCKCNGTPPWYSFR